MSAWSIERLHRVREGTASSDEPAAAQVRDEPKAGVVGEHQPQGAGRLPAPAGASVALKALGERFLSRLG